MSDVSALMDKLKSTISYKQFDAPRSADASTWPVLEKMARAQSALAAAETATPIALTPVAPTPAAPAPQVTESSLFDRLHAEGHSRIEVGEVEAHTGARFARYASPNKAVDDAPQALSAIFERIGRKAR